MFLNINPPKRLTDAEARMAIDAAVADAHRKAEDAARKGNHGTAAYYNGYADGMKRAEAQIPRPKYNDAFPAWDVA